jgi:hypothetical protein
LFPVKIACHRTTHVASIGDENARSAPAFLQEWSSAMQRRRFKQTQTLEERLAEEASRLRSEAKGTPPGTEREELMRRARRAETAAHMNQWLSSPGLQPPK